MPNILDADIPITDIKPTETGVESTARAGLRLGAYGNQIAQSKEREGIELGNAARNGVEAADNFVTHQQINAGAQHGEQLFANLTDSWNKTASSADPHDPSTAAKWREEQLEPALQQFTSGFYTEKGQQWAQERAEQIRSHMYGKTEADMSSLAKDAVVSTVRTLQNTGSNTVFNDPSALSTQFDLLDHSVDGILGANPNLKGADAAAVKLDVAEKTKEQYVKAAVMGAVVKGGDWQSILNDPKYKPYVNAAEIQQFERADRTYRHMDEAAVKSAAAADRETAKVQFNAGANELELSTIPTEPGQRPQLPKDYWDKLKKLGTSNGAALEPGRVASLIKTGDEITARLGKEDPITVKAVEDHLTAGLFDPTHPTTINDIVRAQSDLSDASMKRLVGAVKLLQGEELSDPVFKDTMAGARQIVEGTGPEKMLNAGKYAAFAQAFLPQYLAQKRAGTLPPNALDMNDPKSMISQAIAAVPTSIGATIGANGGVGGPPLPVYTAPKPPAVGENRNGYVFQGGNPADPKSWKPGT